jgi:hypothetical protein
MDSIAVKIRFAPGPTGLLHLLGIIVGGGAGSFRAALAYAAQPDFKAYCKALSAAVGNKAKALFLPLRAAVYNG